MPSNVLSAFIPLASALLGLAITYWINVRTRKVNHVDDLFNEAIAAVAVADSSQHYIRGFKKPDGLPDADYQADTIDLLRMSHQNWVKRTGEACEALARLVPYASWVRPYYTDPASMLGDRPQEVIRLLVEAKSRRKRRANAHDR